MTPYEFLCEEFGNVSRALSETLRRDYGPNRSSEYFTECANRLRLIEGILPGLANADAQTIAAYLKQLTQLASWISLIERSHLGEFSWPFADELREIAIALFTEKNLAGDPLQPIIHVVAEGQGYKIVNEGQVPAQTGRQRFAVVAFPRSLKHHVLLHTIFGHELCHTALFTTVAGAALTAKVVAPLTHDGPMSNEEALNAWLYSGQAPLEVQNGLAAIQHRTGAAYQIRDAFRKSWVVELICDLFGLLLFGPSFLAAHRALLEPLHPSPYDFSAVQPTHPPYALRQRLLVQALRLLGWHIPICDPGEGDIHQAEAAFVEYIKSDPHSEWAGVFHDDQVSAAIVGIKEVLSPVPQLAYERGSAEVVAHLVRNIRSGIPPVRAGVDEQGKPELIVTQMPQLLYAGWVYWIGREKLTDKPLSFLDINRLCDHALLQQRAIKDTLRSAGAA
jgi:hypothetical protein